MSKSKEQPLAPWQLGLIKANLAPRCGARTRKGTQCQSPTVKGSKRCRMHGGTSPGAPKGNQNALKHGYYSHQSIEARKRARKAMSRLQEIMDILEDETPFDGVED